MALDQAVRTLAQYRPFVHEGVDARRALRDLVLAAAVESGGAIASLGECRDTCQTLWGLQVEIEELRAVFGDLVADGQLLKHEGGRYELGEAAGAEIELTLHESAQKEDQALAEWERTLRGLRGDITDEMIATLRGDLEVWLQQLMLRHGVESALLLYPEEPRAQEMLNKLEEMGLDFLPARPREIESLREQAFALFVRQPTESQRLLLASLMNTAYFMTVLTLDPTAKELVENVARGQRVYLDTNIIYRLLNLQTPMQFLSTQRMLQLTKELGYSLAVTPWTIAELRTSLERARTFLKSKAVPPGELAALAASATTDENFITAYWRRLRDKPVSVDDFFDFYNEIEEHLAAHGVEVVTEGTLAVDRDENGIDEQLSVIDGVPGPRFKPEPVKLHDVKHRLLVERLRAGPRRFANAGYWFLTADSSLPRYDNAARQGEPGLPFCVTAVAWLQVIRSLVPRTADYDQTLIDLLSSPYIRYRGRIAYDTVQDVVSRIDLFSGATPDLAAKLLFNTALLREVAEAPEEEARHQLIDNAIVAAAEELEKELAAQRELVEHERQARSEAKAMADRASAELMSERQRVAELEDEIRKERQHRVDALAAAQAESEIDRVDKDHRIETLEGALSAQAQSINRLTLIGRSLLGGLLALAAVAGCATTLALRAVHGAVVPTLIIVASIFVLLGGVAIAVGRQFAWRLLVLVGTVVGIAAAVYDFVKR